MDQHPRLASSAVCTTGGFGSIVRTRQSEKLRSGRLSSQVAAKRHIADRNAQQVARRQWPKKSPSAQRLDLGVAFNRWKKFQNTNIQNGKMMSADKENLHGLSDNEVKRLKNEATNEVALVLNQLEKDYPGITDGAAAIVGSGVGAAGSLAALSALGVPGLSAAGITSGLAAAGALVGGGMVAGIGVLAAPIAIFGIGGYAIAKKRRSAKLAAALAQAISKLYNVQNRLMANAEYFKEEIAGIKATIDLLTKKKPA